MPRTKVPCHGYAPAKNYELLYVVNKQGRQKLALDGEIVVERQPDGKTTYTLLDAALQHGWTKAVLDAAVSDGQDVKASELHTYLGHWIYRDKAAREYAKQPGYWALAVFVLGLVVAVPKDRKRALVYKHGRRLRGPELVTTAKFNKKLGRKKGLTTYLPDGLVLINEARSWMERLFNTEISRWCEFRATER